MGELADPFDGMVFWVTSPDGKIVAEIADRGQVDLKFRGNAYREYDETTLALQLAGLTSKLWARSQQELDEADGQGWSDDGRIALLSRGMGLCGAHVKEGTLAELTEQELSRQFASAVAALFANQTPS